ncbi:hypothetical protein BgiBS90_012382 [Biomphalaria glabrata]|nr:hypothetical protein BgiBS90_012382 [Biomphalaria glabrata]
MMTSRIKRNFNAVALMYARDLGECVHISCIVLTFYRICRPITSSPHSSRLHSTGYFKFKHRFCSDPKQICHYFTTATAAQQLCHSSTKYPSQRHKSSRIPSQRHSSSVTATQQLCHGGTTALSRRHNSSVTAAQQLCHGDTTSLSRRHNSSVTATQQLCHGGTTALSQRHNSSVTAAQQLCHGDTTSPSLFHNSCHSFITATQQLCQGGSVSDTARQWLCLRHSWTMALSPTQLDNGSVTAPRQRGRDSTTATC